MDTTEKQRTLAQVIENEPLLLVDFYTEWCGPCKIMKPILEELEASLGDKAKILRLDVDNNFPAASRYEITGVPTFILFKNGRMVWRKSGVVPPNALEQIILAHA